MASARVTAPRPARAAAALIQIKPSRISEMSEN
jgi:hypothetical protein